MPGSGSGWSRDISENERNHKTFTWWELLVYLTALMLAFVLTAMHQ